MDLKICKSQFKVPVNYKANVIHNKKVECRIKLLMSIEEILQGRIGFAIPHPAHFTAASTLRTHLLHRPSCFKKAFPSVFSPSPMSLQVPFGRS